MDYTYHGVFEGCCKFESGMSHTSEGVLLGGCFVSGFLVGACKTIFWCIMVVTECKVRCKMCNSVVEECNAKRAMHILKHYPAMCKASAV